MTRRIVCAAAVVVATFLSIHPALAVGLDGDTVSARWSFDTLDPGIIRYSSSAAVGPGVEFSSEIPPGDGYFDEADFHVLGLTLIYRRGAGNGFFSPKTWVFEDLDFEGPRQIAAVNFAPGSRTDATISNIGPHSFQIGLPSLAVSALETVTWTFGISTVPIPEPATALLLTLGSSASVLSRRRRGARGRPPAAMLSF